MNGEDETELENCYVLWKKYGIFSLYLLTLPNRKRKTKER